MKKILKINLLNIILLGYLEFIFSILLFDNYNKDSIISIIIYILFSSFIITVLTSIFKEKVNKIINYIIYTIICFWFSLQFVFKSSMQTYFSISLFKLSDQATTFFGKTLEIIFSNLYGMIILFIPLIVLIIFRKKLDYNIEKEKIYLFIYIILIPLSYCSYRLYLSSRKSEELSIYDLYYNVDNISLSVQKLGVLSSLGVDVYRSIFGFEDKLIDIKTVDNTNSNSSDVSIYKENKLDLDLSSKELDSNVKKYIEETAPTYKNKYSGIFEGKNLIFIVAESFSEIGIKEEVTPTLYKLKNNSFVFDNFYVTYYLSTIGGEFQALTGLYPNSKTLSVWRSGTNSFPYGLANTFKNMGYNTYAYHDHSGYFQDRYKYIKSLGFNNFKACELGLNINCNIWPESDVEMINSTYKDYINSDKPFMTYYMTVSGHMDYDFDGNSIASKNKNKVDNLPYSEEAKAYLATQIELDKALELLINKLEESNKLNDTIIVLLGDHYPYGLDLDTINELSTYKRDDLYEINHNALIIWNNNLNTIKVDKVGMPIDVIPTVYNLFGVSYDSRLFAGTDLLSTSEGLAMLEDRSWITNKARYNSTTNSYEGSVDEDYIKNINNTIQNRITFSKDMLLKDGYKYIKINDHSN